MKGVLLLELTLRKASTEADFKYLSKVAIDDESKCYIIEHNVSKIVGVV